MRYLIIGDWCEVHLRARGIIKEEYRMMVELSACCLSSTRRRSISHTAGRRRNSRPLLNFWEISFLLISIVTHAIDLISDSILASGYFMKGNYVWGSVSLMLIIIPNIILQIFSLRWYAADKNLDSIKYLFHFLFLGPVYRFFCVLGNGICPRDRKDGDDDIAQLYRQQNDACILRLFEGFLEAAPQVLLQVYIILATNDQHWFTATSAMVSLVSLSWSVVAYSKALRQAVEPSSIMSYTGLFVIFLWRTLMIGSRISILVIFTSAFHQWIFFALSLRWILMFLWVWWQDTQFTSNFIEERLYNAVVGVILLFMFYNVSDGKTRFRAAAYYIYSISDTTCAYLLWYFLSEDKLWLPWIVAVAVYGSFCLGLFFMMIYYCFLHPSGSSASLSRRNRITMNPKNTEDYPQLSDNPAGSTAQDTLVVSQSEKSNAQSEYTVDRSLI